MTFLELASKYGISKRNLQAHLESAMQESGHAYDDAATLMVARYPALSYGDALTMLTEATR